MEQRFRFNRKAYKKTTAGVNVHRLMAERALGKPLPEGAQVHHLHGSNNSQLVICENQAYHSLLEVRQMAYRECGDAHKRKCRMCKQYDLPENMQRHLTNQDEFWAGAYHTRYTPWYNHSECRKKYRAELKERKKNANKTT